MPRRRKYESRTGFTLVEMIVVLLILAVVTSMAVPAFSRQIDDAKEKKAVTEAQACVTAGTGLGAQLYSKARSTALQSVSTDANASDAVTAALAKWASQVKDDGPALTGDPALTEGQGQYYLKPGQLQGGNAAGADELKAAAGVDGTVEDFWCSGTGQIVYLRYLSADGILVAYTNNGISGSNIAIPTPNVPEPDPEKPDQPTSNPTQPTDKPTESPTTKPSPPSYSDGDLIFEVRDEYTDLPIDGTVDGIRFKLVKLSDGYSNTIVKTIGSATIGSDGRIAFHVPIEELGYVEYWKLIAEDIPAGIQDILPITVQISRQPQNSPTGFKVEQIQHNSNTESGDYSYKKGYVSKEGNAEHEHVCTFYVRRTPTVQFRVVDDLTGLDLPDVKFTISNSSNSVSVSDSSKANTFYVKVHANDKLPAGIKESDCIDLSGSGSGELLYHVTFSKTPSDYHYFETFPLTFYFIYQNGSGHHPTVKYSPDRADHVLSTTVTCEHKDNNSIVTIHVSQYKNVTFHKYSKDDLSLSSIPELSGAHLKLYKADSNNQYIQLIQEWDTGSSAKVIPLEAGAYRLEETSAPQDYTKAEPLYFTLMRNTSGKLELQKGVSDANSYVDDAASSVIMVDTPTVKQVQVQIVDITTGKAWIGVDAQLTGGDSGNMSTADKKWTISSLDNTMHTFRLPLKAGTYTIKIEENTDFVYSEFKFKLVQNGDSFSVEDIKDEHAPDGKVSNNTITMYAYPKVYFYYSINYNNNYDRYLDGASLLIKDSNNTRIDVKGSNAKNPWDIKSTTQGKVLGIATGSYTVSEENRPKNLTCTPWNGYTTTIDDLTPVKFSVKRDQYGHPEIYDSNGYKNWQKRIDVVYQFTS